MGVMTLPTQSACGRKLTRVMMMEAAKKMVSQVHTATMVAWRKAIVPALKIGVRGRVAPSSTIPRPSHTAQ